MAKYLKLASRYLRKELRLSLPPPDQHERIPQRTCTTISRTTTDAPESVANENLGAYRGMAVHHLSDFEIQGRFGLHTGHAQALKLQRLRLSGSEERRRCCVKSKRRGSVKHVKMALCLHLFRIYDRQRRWKKRNEPHSQPSCKN